MAYTIKAKDLSGMSSVQRDRILGEIVAAARAPRNGQAEVIATRIERYEQRYEMRSEVLLDALAKNTIRETADIADWLFWLNVRDNHTYGEARPATSR